MSTSSDPDGDTPPSNGVPQATEPELEKPDIELRAPFTDLPEHATDGHRDVEARGVGGVNGETRPPPTQPGSALDGTGAGLPPDLAVLLVAAARVLVQNTDGEDHHDVEPPPRDGIGLSAFIVASRYRTINVLLILFGVAVCIAALALGSHINPISTISITSVSTVAATFGISAAKKRRDRHMSSQRGADDVKGGSENDNSP